MLTSSKNWGPEIEKLCMLILQANIKEEDKYQIGQTKIFFRAGMLAFLEKRRTDRLNYLVTLMQKNFLRAVHTRRYQDLRSTTIGIQCAWRTILAKREAERQRREAAALQIQSRTRAYLQRTRFLRVRNAAVLLQSGQSDFCAACPRSDSLTSFNTFSRSRQSRKRRSETAETDPSGCRASKLLPWMVYSLLKSRF